MPGHPANPWVSANKRAIIAFVPIKFPGPGTGPLFKLRPVAWSGSARATGESLSLATLFGGLTRTEKQELQSIDQLAKLPISKLALARHRLKVSGRLIGYEPGQGLRAERLRSSGDSLPDSRCHETLGGQQMSTDNQPSN